jgi:hypothetical protein
MMEHRVTIANVTVNEGAGNATVQVTLSGVSSGQYRILSPLQAQLKH